MSEVRSAFACSAGERPAGVGEPRSQLGARHVSAASTLTRRATISARHTWFMTLAAASLKDNIYRRYGVFSRHRILHNTVAATEDR